MRFLCAHNASSVREIRILRVKYVFCAHKIRILHARSIPAADIDSNEIYDDSLQILKDRVFIVNATRYPDSIALEYYMVEIEK